MQPNILFIITHDTGRYLGCYHKQVKTPNLDRLANEGAIFTNHFCPAPQCSPSRGSIMTGRYPHRNGLIGLAHLGFELNPAEQTLPTLLGKAGYATYLFGVQHESKDPARLGYQYIAEQEDRRAEKVAPAVGAFLTQRAGQAQPFFAMVGFFETHRKFAKNNIEPDDPSEVTVPPFLPDTPEVRQDLTEFHGSIAAADMGVGVILDALARSGLEKDTLVIYTTDHGIAFPRAKGTLYDPGLETALLMRWPGVIKPGSQYSQLLCNIDLLPTLLELVGAPIPDNLDGKSFLPLLESDQYSGRDHFFCELTWHDLYRPMRGIRTSRFKYIRHFTNVPGIYLPSDIHGSLSGKVVRDEYYKRPYQSEELYDLQADPLEQMNLIEVDAYSDVAAELRNLVTQEMVRSQDPLMQGPIPGQNSPSWEKQGYPSWMK